MWERWPLFYFLSNHQCVDNQLKLGNMGCLHLGDIFFMALFYGTIISMVWLNELRYLLLKMVHIPKPNPRLCFPTLQSNVWNKLGMDLWVPLNSQFMLFFNSQCKLNQQPMIVAIMTITFAFPHQTSVGLENTTAHGSWCRCSIHQKDWCSTKKNIMIRSSKNTCIWRTTTMRSINLKFHLIRDHYWQNHLHFIRSELTTLDYDKL